MVLPFLQNAMMPTSYPRSANTAVTLAAIPIPIDPPTVRMIATVTGVATIGDGNGGAYYWDYASVAVPDGFNYILSDNTTYAAAGRWIRFPMEAPTPGQVTAPVFSPVDGSFTTTVDVSMTSATAGAAIYYTTDGSTPTSASTLYTVPVTIGATTTFKAIAIKTGLGDSTVTTKVYSLVIPTVATPVFAPTSGSFTTTVDVTITTTTGGAAIYYTDDGSVPTAASTLYVGAITLVATTTLRAIAILGGFADSNVASKVYTLTVTQDVVWGGNSNPTITDFNEWGGGGGDTAFQENFATPIPMADEAFTYPDDVLDAGQYAYFAMRDDQDAPLAPLSGGFKNGAFLLGTGDFSGAGEGFIDTDANGWPCLIGTRPSDGQTWRQYRLLNQPFASITLTVSQ